MASVEASYATELQGARNRLATLKDRAAARARARGDTVQPSQRDALSDAQGAYAVTNRSTDANGLADGAPASELQKLIAVFLLDPANGVPLDSHKIHREVRINLVHNPDMLQRWDRLWLCPRLYVCLPFAGSAAVMWPPRHRHSAHGRWMSVSL